MKQIKPRASVILPVYNEEKEITDCLNSLMKQSCKNIEVIVVDDGSTDKTAELIKRYPVKLLKQKHAGPGAARNLGAKHAKGRILVFGDADHIFSNEFVERLIAPILKRKAIGTFHNVEYVANLDNKWALCWELGRNMPLTKERLDKNAPKSSNVFRAILRKNFLLAGGFDSSLGYADDRLGEKIRVKPALAEGVVCYHKNPSSLKDVFIQSKWIGKGIDIRKKPITNLLTHFFLVSILRGAHRAIKKKEPIYLIFKIVFDFGLSLGILDAFIFKKYSK